MSSPHGAEAAQWTADSARQHIGAEPADVALILGSGLGAVTDDLEEPRSVRFTDIPGFPPPTVAGHAGRLVAGALRGRRVFVLAGRLHAYEGHSLAAVAFPVRVLHALGAKTVLVTNSAGGIRDDLTPGDLMMIEDHLNLMFNSPLTGPQEQGDTRFTDMSEPYDRALRELLLKAGNRAGVSLKTGVYAGLRGPSYETPAETRMLRSLGADAVGMSTVPEVTVARALGVRVAAVSCITNRAGGLPGEPLTHDEVIETARRISASFRSLVREFVAGLD